MASLRRCHWSKDLRRLEPHPQMSGEGGFSTEGRANGKALSRENAQTPRRPVWPEWSAWEAAAGEEASEVMMVTPGRTLWRFEELSILLGDRARQEDTERWRGTI